VVATTTDVIGNTYVPDVVSNTYVTCTTDVTATTDVIGNIYVHVKWRHMAPTRSHQG